MRWMVLLVSVSAGACTRLNPAYEGSGDELAATSVAGTDEGMTGAGPGTGVTTTVGPSTTVDPDSGATSMNVDTTATSGSSGEVQPECPLKPMDGLTIALGDPARFGGVCPTGFSMWTAFQDLGDDGVVLSTCNAGCSQCSGSEGNPLSMLPLVAVEDYFPQGACLMLEAEELVGETDTRCHYGALTVFDSASDVPYIVATTGSTEPTPIGGQLLADIAPEPVNEITCECDAVGVDDVCCEAEGAVTFWSLAINGHVVAPGETATVELPQSNGIQHAFTLFQAQDLNACNAPYPEQSWALLTAI